MVYEPDRDSSEDIFSDDGDSDKDDDEYDANVHL